MKKRDILTPIGITFGFMFIMTAILASGGREGLSTFIEVAAILIVIGGIISSLLINFKFEQIKLLPIVFKEAFRKKDQNIAELIQLFIRLSERARKEGILS